MVSSSVLKRVNESVAVCWYQKSSFVFKSLLDPNLGTYFISFSIKAPGAKPLIMAGGRYLTLNTISLSLCFLFCQALVFFSDSSGLIRLCRCRYLFTVL